MDEKHLDGAVYAAGGADGACILSLYWNRDGLAWPDGLASIGWSVAELLIARAGDDQGDHEAVADLAAPDGTTLQQMFDGLEANDLWSVRIGRYARFKASGGHIGRYVHHNSKLAALVELVGHGVSGERRVQALGVDLAIHVAFHRKNDRLAEQPFLKDESRTVGESVEDVRNAIGKPLALGRWARVSAMGP